jgi:hypothetical protein
MKFLIDTTISVIVGKKQEKMSLVEIERGTLDESNVSTTEEKKEL